MPAPKCLKFMGSDYEVDHLHPYSIVKFISDNGIAIPSDDKRIIFRPRSST
jgi:hypothetical protein